MEKTILWLEDRPDTIDSMIEYAEKIGLVVVNYQSGHSRGARPKRACGATARASGGRMVSAGTMRRPSRGHRWSAPATLDAFEKALAISEGLARADPANRDWQRDLQVIANRIGDVLAKQGDLNGARKAYRTSLEIAERLAAADPSNIQLQRDLGVSYEKIGKIYEPGDTAAALAEYRTSLEIAERLAAADPANVVFKRELLLGYANVGRILMKQGDLQAALDHYRRSLAISEQLAAADPSNTELQQGVLQRQSSIGELLDKEGQVQEAIAAYQASLAIAERLAAAEPTNADWQYLSYRQLGLVRELEGNREEARDMYCRAKSVAESALQSGEPQWQKRLDWLENRLDLIQGTSRC